ncbi:hypothetical protein IQ06DRAFT_69074 [Phaeosphaeriaceae sp. SRC1lsM3a]|nr:hypothetical protein IQ06DRAFT_69074 [Stagonospora sp. SRC1lsM3a]
MTCSPLVCECMRLRRRAKLVSIHRRTCRPSRPDQSDEVHLHPRCFGVMRSVSVSYTAACYAVLSFACASWHGNRFRFAMQGWLRRCDRMQR